VSDPFVVIMNNKISLNQAFYDIKRISSVAFEFEKKTGIRTTRPTANSPPVSTNSPPFSRQLAPLVKKYFQLAPLVKCGRLDLKNI
jgi:hypothetical protein